MYFRVKRTGPYAYLQIVSSHRQGKQVRQQVLATLGRLEGLQASGQLDRLLRSGARFGQQMAWVDAHAAGATEAVEVVRIGPDLGFGRLWEALGIGRVLHQLLERRRYEFGLERAVYLTVLHRLFASGSDRAAERWRQHYRIPGAEALKLHHLYRAMGFLGQPLEESPARAGQGPRCAKDWIEEQLFERRRDLFSQIDLVFFDTTSIYFEGQGGQQIGRYGKSKDHRPDRKQLVVGLALDAQGWPLCCQMWPGNTADMGALLPVVRRLRRGFGVGKVSLVADRGMISAKTIEALESGQLGCDYILGARMGGMKEVRDQVLSHRGRYEEIYPERQGRQDPMPLKVKEVVCQGRRYILCLNEEQRRKDAAEREAIVEQLRQQLKRGDKSLIGNPGYRKFVKVAGKQHFVLDAQKMRREARYDGKWVLRTNMELEPKEVALAYKQLWRVEDLFRTMKSILETRPIYHQCDATIRGHVFCSFLALLMKRELESRLEAKGEQWEWAEILRGLDNLYEVQAELGGQRFALRSQFKAQAHKGLAAAGVASPPTLRELK